MKKIAFFLLTLFMGTAAFAQEQGITFVHDKSWSDILTLAKESNKLVFMDAYTTWCAPCKKMEKYVFTKPEVGTFYNENFISIKMNMEKGDGVTFAKKYEVKAFPTLLYFSPVMIFG